MNNHRPHASRGLRPRAASGNTTALGLPVTLTALLLLAACGMGGRAGGADATSQAADDAEARTVFAVASTTTSRGQLFDYLELFGDVRASTEIAIYPDASGKLSRLLVSVGDAVQANQQIAEVDPSRPGAQFASSPVRTSITGTITSLPVQTGATVSPQAVIARVGQLDRLEIVTAVAEKFLARVRVGQAAQFTLSAYPNETFTGTVSRLAAVVDPVTRTLEVTLRPTSNDRRLRPGMFAEIRLITADRRQIVKMPASALVENDTGSFVYVVDASNEPALVIRREVTTGIRIDGKVEVLTGLEADEIVVVQGQNLLDEGVPVRIVRQLSPLPESDTPGTRPQLAVVS